MVTMTDAKACAECGEPIIGRSDKKFCSAQCRTSFHNRLNSDTVNYMRKVNRILRKNRSILCAMNPNGKTKIAKKRLVSKGFDFHFFTNVYKTKTGRVYYFCYEQGYLSLDDGYFALVVREEWIDQ
jgi:hypothetical protein